MRETTARYFETLLMEIPTVANAGKKCEALKVAKSIKPDAILKLAKAEWVKRFVNADGSVKKNRWAPIYIEQGDKKLSARILGDEMVLFGPIASCPKPAPKHTEWA